MKEDKHFIQDIDELESYLKAKESKEFIYFIGLAIAIVVALGIIFYRYNTTKQLRIEKENIAIKSDSLDTMFKNEIAKHNLILHDTTRKLQSYYNSQINSLQSRNKIIHSKAIKVLNANDSLKIANDSLKNENINLKQRLSQRTIDRQIYTFQRSNPQSQEGNLPSIDNVELRNIINDQENALTELSNILSTLKTPDLETKYTTYIYYASGKKKDANDIKNEINEDNSVILKPLPHDLRINSITYFYPEDEIKVKEIAKRYKLKIDKQTSTHFTKPGQMTIFLVK